MRRKATAAVRVRTTNRVYDAIQRLNMTNSARCPADPLAENEEVISALTSLVGLDYGGDCAQENFDPLNDEPENIGTDAAAAWL